MRELTCFVTYDLHSQECADAREMCTYETTAVSVYRVILGKQTMEYEEYCGKVPAKSSYKMF